MGLFGGIKDNWKKAEAAVIIQNVFENLAKYGSFEGDPAKVANTLITDVWELKPDIYSGKFGQRPHKISVASAALAQGAMSAHPESSARANCAIALGQLLGEVETNGRLYPLNSLDHTLLEAAVSIFTEISTEIVESPLGQSIDELMGSI